MKTKINKLTDAGDGPSIKKPKPKVIKNTKKPLNKDGKLKTKANKSQDLDEKPAVKMPKLKVLKSSNNQPDEAVKEKVAGKEKTGAKGKPFKKSFKHGKTEKVEKKVLLTKKERREKVKQSRKHHEVVAELLVLWEELRKEETLLERRVEVCDRIDTLTQGKIRELIFAHDTVRVFESVLLHGEDRHKLRIFEEVKKDILEMAKSKYARFIVLKLLSYGNREQRSAILKAMEGKIVKLLKHGYAAETVELAYNDYANAAQRASVVQEFYGATFTVFRSPDITSLEKAIAQDPAKKGLILENMREILLPIVQKGLAKHSVIQHVLLEFLEHADDNGKRDMVEALREQLVPLLHTREGVKCAMSVVWNANAKDRKLILRSLKACVGNVCVDEHGYLFILSLLDSIDDVVILNKIVLKEITESLKDLVPNPHGRKVLFYLVSRRDPVHFPPQLVTILSKGDANPNSKKEAAARAQEILACVAGALLDFVTKNCPMFMEDNAGILLLAQILTKCFGPDTSESRMAALTSVAQLLAEPFIPVGHKMTPKSKKGTKRKRPDDEADEEEAEEEKSMHLAERPAGQILLRWLFKKNKETGDGEFARAVMQCVNDDNLRSWIVCNRSCFLLVHLYEAGGFEDRLKTVLEPVLDTLKNSPLPGAKILVKKLTCK